MTPDDVRLLYSNLLTILVSQWSILILAMLLFPDCL